MENKTARDLAIDVYFCKKGGLDFVETAKRLKISVNTAKELYNSIGAGVVIRELSPEVGEIYSFKDLVIIETYSQDEKVWNYSVKFADNDPVYAFGVPHRFIEKDLKGLYDNGYFNSFKEERA